MDKQHNNNLTIPLNADRENQYTGGQTQYTGGQTQYTANLTSPSPVSKSQADKPSKMLFYILILLSLNLLTSLAMIAGFAVFAINTSNAIQNATNILSNVGILPQVSKLIRTNLDLTTWRSMLQDASSKLDQVKDVDWSHSEKFTQYQQTTCAYDPQFSDRATCLAFVGDSGKKCQWYLTATGGTNPPCQPEDGGDGCCWGTAASESQITQTISITEDDSNQAKKFITKLQSSINSAINQLPSTSSPQTPSHPGLSNKTCAATPAPLAVESSLINAPQFADTLLRDLDCLVTKISDQGDSITVASAKAIWEAIQSVVNFNNNGPPAYPHQEDNDVNSFIANANMFKSFANKYIATIKN